MAEPPSIRFRCTLCAFCCCSYTPLITAADAGRIQQHLRQPLSFFLVFYRPEDFAVSLDNEERLFTTKHGPLVMGLLRKEQACVFLKDNLCSVYQVRPGICRAFPFQPLESGNVEGPFELLPDPCNDNNADDETVSQHQAREAYQSFIYDYYTYVEQVKRWNADPRSKERDIEDFLRYVGLDWRHYEIPEERRYTANGQQTWSTQTRRTEARRTEARRT